MEPFSSHERCLRDPAQEDAKVISVFGSKHQVSSDNILEASTSARLAGAMFPKRRVTSSQKFANLHGATRARSGRQNRRTPRSAPRPAQCHRRSFYDYRLSARYQLHGVLVFELSSGASLLTPGPFIQLNFETFRKLVSEKGCSTFGSASRRRRAGPLERAYRHVPAAIDQYDSRIAKQKGSDIIH